LNICDAVHNKRAEVGNSLVHGVKEIATRRHCCESNTVVFFGVNFGKLSALVSSHHREDVSK
jgi:hypothetical protein